jgi:hypothetical protein
MLVAGLEILPRSVFYSLDPIALGSPMVESLTGYLRRLAAAHEVSVLDFICHEIFNELFPATADRRMRRHLFLASAYLLDGSFSHSPKWASKLEAGTLQNGLQFMTLLPFQGVIHDSWLRRRRAWCPYCLWKWKIGKTELSDPLIWSIRIVDVCPIDFQLITETCPHCKNSAMPFAGNSAPGICGICGKPLWSEKEAWNSRSTDQYAVWCALEISAVLKAIGEFTTQFAAGSLAKVLAAKIAGMGDRTWKERIAAAGCSKRSRYLWENGVASPRPETFLRICFNLGLRPINMLREALQQSNSLQTDDSFARQTCWANLFTIGQEAVQKSACGEARDIDSAETEEDRTASDPGAIRNSLARRRVPIRLSLPLSGSKPQQRVRYIAEQRSRQIRNALETALEKMPPPTVNAVAVWLKMSSSTTLRGIEPELCRKLSLLREQYDRQQQSKIQSELNAAIQCVRLPSLGAFCKSTGIPLSFVRRDFPALKLAYEERYRFLKGIERNTRAKQIEAEVVEAVRRISEKGEYPSVARVKSVSPSLKSAGWDTIQIAIRKSRPQLSSPPQEAIGEIPEAGAAQTSSHSQQLEKFEGP